MALKNERFIYTARNNQTGLADVTARVRRNGVEVAVGVALTEVGQGRYQLLLTPVLLAGYGGEGYYDLYINSATVAFSAPATAARWILENDSSDLEGHLDTLEGKIDIIDQNVDDIKGEVQHGTWGLSQLKNLIDAIQSSVSTIQNVTRFVAAVPEQMIRPEAGDNHYVIPMRLYDTAGNLEDPDSNSVLVSIVDEAGNDRSNYLDGWVAGPVSATRTGLGVYTIGLDIPAGVDAEQLVFTFEYAENAIALSAVRTSHVIDDIANSGYALEATSQNIYTDTQDIKPRVLDIQTLVNHATNGLAALRTLLDTVDSRAVGIRGELDNATYGLANLKTVLDTKASQTSVNNLQTDVTDNVKGTGFDQSLDTLHQLSLRTYYGGRVV